MRNLLAAACLTFLLAGCGHIRTVKLDDGRKFRTWTTAIDYDHHGKVYRVDVETKPEKAEVMISDERLMKEAVDFWVIEQKRANKKGAYMAKVNMVVGGAIGYKYLYLARFRKSASGNWTLIKDQP